MGSSGIIFALLCKLRLDAHLIQPAVGSSLLYFANSGWTLILSSLQWDHLCSTLQTQVGRSSYPACSGIIFALLCKLRLDAHLIQPAVGSSLLYFANSGWTLILSNLSLQSRAKMIPLQAG